MLWVLCRGARDGIQIPGHGQANANYRPGWRSVDAGRRHTLGWCPRLNRIGKVALVFAEKSREKIVLFVFVHALGRRFARFGKDNSMV